MERSVDDLEANAVKFWPSVLAEREASSSIIPRLIETQDKFISILHVADESPTSWKKALAATTGVPANLFLKHLAVLSDIGGERLQRFHSELAAILDDRVLRFRWKDSIHEHAMPSLDCRSWTNSLLHMSGRELESTSELTPSMEDVTMLLLFGGAATNSWMPDEILNNCTIGSLLGEQREIAAFVRQRYIWVSRITGGAKANTMGHLAQRYVREVLEAELPGWDFSRTTIPGISQNAGRTDMAFDIVAVSPGNRYCAIEVSFQVTTNSTIERKAGQAEGRQAILRQHGHFIAYVIDGAGNFHRRSALGTICRHSDCTVSYKDGELAKLATFLRGMERTR